MRAIARGRHGSKIAWKSDWLKNPPHRHHAHEHRRGGDSFRPCSTPSATFSSEKEIALVKDAKRQTWLYHERTGSDFINRSEAATAFMSQFDNALPIWGIQKEKEDFRKIWPVRAER